MQIDIPKDLESHSGQEFATGRNATFKKVVVPVLDPRGIRRSGFRHQTGLRDAAAGRTPPLAEAFADIRKEFDVNVTTTMGRSSHWKTVPGGCDLVEFATRRFSPGRARPEQLPHLPLRAWVELTCARNGTMLTGDGHGSF